MVVAIGDYVETNHIINSIGQPSKMLGIVVDITGHSDGCVANYNEWYVIQYFNGKRASLPATALTVISHNGNDYGEEGNL